MTEQAIRPLRQDDIPLIVEWMLADTLWLRYGLDAGAIESGFRAALDRGDLLLVADAELPARGFAWCLLDGMLGAYPYLKRLGVDPAFGGRGIGGRLLAGIEQLVRAEQGRVLFLLVSDFNVAAQRFYQRHGYRQVGAIPQLVLPDVAELIYSKELGTLA